MYEKILLVTRRTRLAGLVERFNTKKQAKFYVEHAGQDFEEFEREDDAYLRAVDRLRDSLDVGLPVQQVDRGLVPTFLFSGKEVVVVAGQDGLVANVAKYVGEQPLVGVNPDPERFDGVLLPYEVAQARGAVRKVLEGKARLRGVTLAEARLEDGQRLLAFNDLFIGARTHVSARYRLSHGGQEESQSSSGVLVSTGAGSSGWLSSVFTLARSLTAQTGGVPGAPWRLGWEEPRLAFVVREPFVSRHSGAEVVGGFVTEEQELVLESRMPSGGVIFSDGMEEDFLVFGAGARAHIRPARQRARLVVG
ncbi:diacylglycerol kinase catalytic domain-containing protein [Myxococcus qinghaiensis]|uniref:NAD+ kinase n=1 Tax=Myxococcus qinghaiensis TaxID=2906758 RepID=UPI0020A7187E|nr:NAD+ kinase [Myxococcus qinghaiensis]MCP3168420.1 NAD+ kinase [Myxococcus qinghaiensis]